MRGSDFGPQESHLVVPVRVGPVVEKGMVPQFRGLSGQVDR